MCVRVCMNARVHGMEVCMCLSGVCVCVCERELMMSETQNFVLMNRQCTPFTQTVHVAFCFDESAMHPLHPNSPCGFLFCSQTTAAIVAAQH